MSEPRTQHVCGPCVEFRRGQRENLTVWGISVHVCERKRDGQGDFDACACGCVDRKPGQIAQDRRIYGNVFLGPSGERIDPTMVRSA